MATLPTKPSSIRKVAFACLVCAFLVYLVSYVVLRNRSMRENAPYNTEGMLYESMANIERTHDLTTHHFLARLFMPLNLIDQLLFGGEPPVRSILFDLS